MTSKKSALALAAAAALLAGCATGPYYDRYAYADGTYYERPVNRDYDYATAYRDYDYAPAYRYYDYGPAYYPNYYFGPSLGFGLSFSNRGHWRRH